MTDLFIQVFNMSITATYIIAVVLLIRLLFGRKLPKLFSYALWGIVLLRLMLPFSMASAFSVLNLINTPPPTPTGVIEYMPQHIGMMREPQINTGSVVIDSLPAATPAASMNPMQVWIYIAARAWAGVTVLLLLYFGISYAIMAKRLKTAVPYKKNILLSDQVKSPLVFGIIKPRIILPVAIEKMCGANEIGYIIAHEQVHMQRFDHITKLLSLLVLAVYWFNPAIWLAFILSNQDRELACDEGVMQRWPSDIRAEYAHALVNMGVHKGSFFGALAFGESNIKTRIKSIVNFKKPSLWLSLAGIIIAVMVGAACLTNGADSSASAKVDQYLDTMVNEASAATSSNPYDYINANRAAFQGLVALGEEGRKAMLQMFAETDDNGLKEYIMAIACNTIKPVLAEGGFDSGRAWYEAYLRGGENADLKEVVKTDYSRVKIKFFSDMTGFKNATEFSSADLSIVATVDAMMKSATPYEGDVPDLQSNHIDQYAIELSSQIGGYSCQMYYDTLYGKAYLGKDGGLNRISTDAARYIDSLLENAQVDTAMDTEAVALFKRYGWTLDYRINRLQVTLGNIGKLSDFEPNAYYFAYNNALSQDIGLDMSPYANTKVEVEIYRIREEMPPASNPNKNTRGIVVKNHTGIIGAYISAGRHSTFSACSLKGNDFAGVTGSTFNQWLEKHVIAAKNETFSTPEQAITAYFQALEQKRESAARRCIARETMLGNLSSNLLDEALYQETLSLPLTNTTYNIENKNAFGNLKSAKLIKMEPMPAPDDTATRKTFAVTADLAYAPDESQSSGEQSWDCTLVYETPQTGWKINGFGH